MAAEPLVVAHGLLEQVVAAVEAACGPGIGDDDLLSVLRFCEGVSRQMERLGVTALAGLIRRGTLAERGYASVPKALSDLVGLDWAEARRRAVVAEQAVARVGLDGAALPARLPATARCFAAGGCSLRAVEVIARVLAAPAARRLSPEVWAAAEERLAAVAGEYSPADLQAWGGALVETLDQDGPEPDDRPSAQINELHLTRHAAVRAGGSGVGSTTRPCSPRSLPLSTRTPPRAPPTTTGAPGSGRPKPMPMPAATSLTTPKSPPAAANART